MKQKYVCGSCNFRFEAEREPRRCPYCDKETVYSETRDTDLMKDVDDFLK